MFKVSCEHGHALAANAPDRAAAKAGSKKSCRDCDRNSAISGMRGLQTHQMEQLKEELAAMHHAKACRDPQEL